MAGLPRAPSAMSERMTRTMPLPTNSRWGRGNDASEGSMFAASRMRGTLELEQPHDEWTGHRHQHTGDRVRSSIADRRFLPTGKALDDDQGGR